MIVYIYSKCSTCQKALRFLEHRKVAFSPKEIIHTPPSIDELLKMLDYYKGNLKKIFNTSGLLYKELHLGENLKNMPLNRALELLNNHGMLVKRPFLINNHLGLVGFNEKEWVFHFA